MQFTGAAGGALLACGVGAASAFIFWRSLTWCDAAAPPLFARLSVGAPAAAGVYAALSTGRALLWPGEGAVLQARMAWRSALWFTGAVSLAWWCYGAHALLIRFRDERGDGAAFGKLGGLVVMTGATLAFACVGCAWGVFARSSLVFPAAPRR